MIRRASQEDYVSGQFISIHSTHEQKYELVEISGECTNRRKISFEKHILGYASQEKPLIIDFQGVRRADTTFYAEMLHLLVERSKRPSGRVYLCGLNGLLLDWMSTLHCENVVESLNTTIFEDRESAIEEIVNQ